MSDHVLTAAEQRGWTSARTLQDLGRLTAEWLEGNRRWIPTYLDADPDDETHPAAVRALIAVNRIGWVTDSSQPGLVTTGWRQRAYASGRASAELAAYAEHLAATVDLVVLTVRPVRDPASIGEPHVDLPVTMRRTGGRWRGETFLGRCSSIDEHARFYLPVAPSTAQALQQSVELQVVDPVWGRDDLRWPWLEALTASTQGLAD